SAHLRAELGQLAGELVPERGRHGKLRVAAEIRFEVGATGERRSHPHDHSVRVRPGARKLSQLDRAGADEHMPAHRRQGGTALVGSGARHRASPLTGPPNPVNKPGPPGRRRTQRSGSRNRSTRARWTTGGTSADTSPPKPATSFTRREAV